MQEHPATIPPTSCRAGALVSLLNSNGAQVPVRLQVLTQEDVASGHTKHVVCVRKVDAGSPSDMYGDKRLTLTCTMDGKVRAGVVGRGRGVRHTLHTAHTTLLCSVTLPSSTHMWAQVLSVDQPTSLLFGFTSGSVVGSNLADCIDVFAEWREKAGAHQTELLLLSLLDKEAEMPGACRMQSIIGSLAAFRC